MRHNTFDRFTRVFFEKADEGGGGGDGGKKADGGDGAKNDGGKKDEGGGGGADDKKNALGDDGKKKDEPKKDEPKGPVIPEKYTFKLSEGGPLTDAHVPAFEARAKALGLTQEQAQKMVDAEATERASVRAAFRTELENDKELGGKNLAETEKLARAGRDILFPPNSEEAKAFIDLLEETGYVNHRLLVRAFARLGRMNAEDGHQGGGGGEADSSDPMETAKTAFYGDKYSKSK